MTGGRDCAILRRAPLGDTKLSEASSPEIAAGGAIYVAEEHGRKTTRALFAILCYQGYAFAILGVGAPFIGKSFALDQSGIARMYAWISLNSIGALVLSRMADLIGRRRILMLSLLVTPLGSLGALLSSSAAWFILFEILVYSAIGATFGSAIVMMAEALPIEKRSEGQGWAKSRNRERRRHLRDTGADPRAVRALVAMAAGSGGNRNRTRAGDDAEAAREPKVGAHRGEWSGVAEPFL